MKKNNIDIVFINSPLTLKERYEDFALSGAIEPPIGLCCIAAVTRINGFSTYLIDAEALCYDKHKILIELQNISPKYIGISSTTAGILKAAELADFLKKNINEIIIILGGNHISALPIETFEEFPSFDLGVIGEGEQTIIELLKALENNLPIDNIDGIIFRENGEIIQTNTRALIKNIDELPFPAWDLLPDIKKFYRVPSQSSKKNPVMPLITSRGCAHKCIFCDRKVFGNKVRMHSAEYTLNMIKF